MVDVFYPHLNYFSVFKFDPVILYIMKIGSLKNEAYLYIELFFFFWGTLFLLKELGAKFFKSLLGALLVVVFCFFVMGGGDAYLLCLYCFPFLLASLIRLKKNPSFFNLIFSILISFFWIFTANALVVFGSMLCVFLSVALEKSKNSFYFSLVSISLILFSLFHIPVYQMPNFPYDARLSPISILSFRTSPILGGYVHPSTLIWDEYKKANLIYSFRFLVLSLVFLLSMSLFKNYSKKTIFLLSVFLAFILLETFLSGSPYYYMTPYQALWHIVPGVSFANLFWMIFPIFGCLLFSIGIIEIKGSVLFSTFLSILLLVILPKFYKVDSLEFKDIFNTEISSPFLFNKTKKNSPSAFVIKHFGDWVIGKNVSKKYDFNSLKRLVNKKDFRASVSASVNTKDAYKVFDNDSSTRWGTNRPQKEGDTFFIKFTSPIRLIKVVLSIKGMRSDFPRGILVEGSRDCRRYFKILNYPKWNGPVSWTKEGYPFFLPESWVILDFPKREKLRCIKFIQTSSHPIYDWSIAELKLYN